MTSQHHKTQSNHLSGKPGNVREFDSCQGNVRDFTKNQGNFREKILSGKSCQKLFIVNCIFVSIQVFSTNTGMIWVTLKMPSATEECREPSGNFILSGVWRLVTLNTVSCNQFLLHDAMHSADYAVARCPSVCLSICLLHAGILSKRLNVSSYFSHQTWVT